MSTTPSLDVGCPATVGGSDSHRKQKSKFDTAIKAIEKISAAALGIFSACVSFKLFVPFFFTGISIGIYSYIQDKKSCGHTDLTSSCAHGLLEQLTGVKLPPIVSLAANVAATVCHIDHHSNVFVPIIGISIGTWLGKNASHYGVLMHKKINVYFTENSRLPPFAC